MSLSKPQFYYHVTNKRWANKVTLHPRSSYHKEVKGRPDYEPPLARICVSKNVSGCFSAIAATLGMGPFYIFRTYRKVRAKYPWRVVDTTITKERWITKPCVFVKVGTFNKKKMIEIFQSKNFSDITGSDYEFDLINQKKCLELVLRPKCIQWGFN